MYTQSNPAGTITLAAGILLAAAIIIGWFIKSLASLKRLGKIRYVLWGSLVSVVLILTGLLANEKSVLILGIIGAVGEFVYIVYSDKTPPMTDEELQEYYRKINSPAYREKEERENRKAEQEAKEAEAWLNYNRYGVFGNDTGRRVNVGGTWRTELETGPLGSKVYVCDDEEPLREDELY